MGKGLTEAPGKPPLPPLAMRAFILRKNWVAMSEMLVNLLLHTERLYAEYGQAAVDMEMGEDSESKPIGEQIRAIYADLAAVLPNHVETVKSFPALRT